MINDREQINPIPLSRAVVDRRYRVLSVDAKGAVRQRMLDMGLVPGICLSVVRFAPLGDPIEIRIHRFLMSLRKEEAMYVIVTDLGPRPHYGQRLGRGRGPGRLRHFHGRR
ncbi:MAG: FeoA domain-containing protein [Candidatus Marinimicrobia bacterium]|nr:FeoA domain-containing protein [Candidatus Neomarinimicrobiota bacterium]